MIKNVSIDGKYFVLGFEVLLVYFVEILSLFVKNATIKQLKDILKEKNIEEIPIEKKELQLKVSHLLQKEFK